MNLPLIRLAEQTHTIAKGKYREDSQVDWFPHLSVNIWVTAYTALEPSSVTEASLYTFDFRKQISNKNKQFKMPVSIVGEQKLYPTVGSIDEVSTEEWLEAAHGSTEIIGKT